MPRLPVFRHKDTDAYMIVGGRHMNNNSLNGSIPKELGSLPNLVHMYDILRLSFMSISWDDFESMKS